MELTPRALSTHVVSAHALGDERMLVIRPAVVADAAALLEYFEAVGRQSDFLTFGPGEFGLSKEDEESHLRSVAAKDNEIQILGLIDGAIVSVLTFAGGKRPRIRHRGEFGLSVREGYWGLGIGALMLDHLIDWARRSGVITKINLLVRADNVRAIRLYERKGFLREGTISREIRVRGEYYDSHQMGLEL